MGDELMTLVSNTLDGLGIHGIAQHLTIIVLFVVASIFYVRRHLRRWKTISEADKLFTKLTIVVVPVWVIIMLFLIFKNSK
jgi:hypothetical protein